MAKRNGAAVAEVVLDPTDTVGTPDFTVDRFAVADLVPYARNARTHSPDQIAKLAASIREFGFTIPVLVAENLTIIAGHGRVLAAQLVGMLTVPAIVVSGWSDAQIRAYVIADNRLALDAGWDEDLLRLDLGELEGLIDLALTGFTPTELDLLFTDVGAGEPNAVVPPPAIAVSVRGDIWALGRHRILCGAAKHAGMPDVGDVPRK